MAFNSFSLSGSLGVVAPCRGGLNAGSVLGHHPREPLAAAPHGWDRVDNKKPDRQTCIYYSLTGLTERADGWLGVHDSNDDE